VFGYSVAVAASVAGAVASRCTMPVATVASLKRIAPLTPPTSAGPSSTNGVPTPASSGPSVKLTPPPLETPGSGSRLRRSSRSSEDAAPTPGSSTLALPEDMLAEERRQHARTRELLETQLAAREREILLLRAELKEAKARPRRRAHKQPSPPSPAKQAPVRWSWSVSLWPWLGAHQPRALASAEQLQVDETGVATSCVDEEGNSSDDEGGEGGEGGEGLASPVSHVSDSVADDAGGGAPAGSSLLEGSGGGGGRRAAAQRTAPPAYWDTKATVRFRQRIPWLLGLMQVQSISSLVLDRYTDILEHHLNVSAFLTMALGTGGNVGGQAVAEIIKALRAGEVRRADFGRLVREEVLVGLMLGLSLFAAAFVRVLAFGQCDLMEVSLHPNLYPNPNPKPKPKPNPNPKPKPNPYPKPNPDQACTVALACLCLVSFTSVLAPLVTLGLSLCRMETAGAPPTITVLVDLLGTFLVCQLVRMLLHSRMVDHDDMTKGYVWTVSSELEQWEEDLGMI